MRTLVVLFISLNCCFGFAQISDFKSVNFEKADNRAKRLKGESLDTLYVLSYKLTEGLTTDVEKFRAIYTWVCTNIRGDINSHNSVTRHRKKYNTDSSAFKTWNNVYKQKVFKRLFKRKRTMCTGYAYLIKELATYAGIDCEIVDGYGRSTESNIDALTMANHSWNAVKLNNKWYLCDATWSSGYFVNDGFVQAYNDGYFLASPQQFASSHYPLKADWLLGAEVTSNSFVKAPLVYGEAFKHQLSEVLPSQMKLEVNKGETINFEFSVADQIKPSDINLVIFGGEQARALPISEVKLVEGKMQFSYTIQFKGYFDLHLQVKDDIVVTYAIKSVKLNS